MRQTKLEALRDIIAEANSERRTKAGLARINRASRTLELTNGETEGLLIELDYARPSTGELYPFTKR